MSDGNLRQIFQKMLPQVHWQGVETWSTGQGVPDMNGCLNGVEFWIENKTTSGRKVDISSQQIAWAERRVRAGGRVFLAVRRKAPAGPRRGGAVDELWLFHGSQIRDVTAHGIHMSQTPLGAWGDGPAKWNWPIIVNLLTIDNHYN